MDTRQTLSELVRNVPTLHTCIKLADFTRDGTDFGLISEQLLITVKMKLNVNHLQ